MHVLIVGGHQVAYFLTKSMASKGYDVSVLNRDGELCRAVARNPNLLVINGEHTDPRSMADAGADRADAVMALAESDAENFMICQMAASLFGCPRTGALVNDPAHEAMFKKVGISVALSVVGLLGTLLEKQLVSEIISNMAYIEDGRIVVTEIVIPQDSPAVGTTLTELELPEGAILTTIIRGDEVIIPRGQTLIRAGDKAVLVTLPADQGAALRILGGKSAE
ncbi:MAG: NAD-binding protein [Bacillota bacterium]